MKLNSNSTNPSAYRTTGDNQFQILQGTCSQFDRKFRHPGIQCIANFAIAIKKTGEQDVDTWDSSYIDQVLWDGDDYFHDTYLELLKTGKAHTPRYIAVRELKRKSTRFEKKY